MNELLLGFQLRVTPETLDHWDEIRRKTYLLSEQVETPLSVDKSVWPLSRESHLLSEIFVDYSPLPHSAPNGLGLYAVASSAISKLTSRCDHAFLLGITAFDECARTLQSKHCIQNLQPISWLCEGGWKCSGYDVADSWLCSGLMNCGYGAEKSALYDRFGSGLNRLGLFQSAEVATMFSDESNKRVPEHAPFFVYGIWTKERLDHA